MGPIEPATPDSLGVPGAVEGAPTPDDPLLSYFADGSFYTGVAGFLLPGLTLVVAFGAGSVVLALVPLLFALLGPAAIVLGVLAQRRPGVRWTNGTAWLGIFLGALDTLIYGIVLAATFGFIL